MSDEQKLFHYKLFVQNICDMLALDIPQQYQDLNSLFDETKDIFISQQQELTKVLSLTNSTQNTKQLNNFSDAALFSVSYEQNQLTEMDPKPDQRKIKQQNHMILSDDILETSESTGFTNNSEFQSTQSRQELCNSVQTLPKLKRIKISKDVSKIYINSRKSIQFLSNGQFVSLMRRIVQTGGNFIDYTKENIIRAALLLRLLPNCKISLSNMYVVEATTVMLKDFANKIDKNFLGFSAHYHEKQLTWYCGAENMKVTEKVSGYFDDFISIYDYE